MVQSGGIVNKTCPVCRIDNEEIELAVHLMSTHEWKYEKAMDWIRAQEEIAQ